MPETQPDPKSEQPDTDPAAKPGADKFLVVGLGASAGGMEALTEFFRNVPAPSGIAYVALLQLPTGRDTGLAEAIRAVTPLPVTQLTEGVKLAPDQIYLVPPDRHLVMNDGFITPSDAHLEEQRAPVDIFFRTLADAYDSRVVCVVLSGIGANGSMGLKRVKESGGVAYAQNPGEAGYNEMPRNAIATGLVDEVLPVAEIPHSILTYRNSLGKMAIAEEAEQRPEQQQKALREIFAQLRARTGNDFSNYKRATLLRRIERRINVRNLPDLPGYAAFLQQNPDETQALLKDLLISVTNFFRDKKAFEALEKEVLPALLEGKRTGSEVRIWVAGCATGEEAYSIAMQLAEQVFNAPDMPKVQIIATDIDEAAIAVARDGLYTLNDAADVPADRLSRFFTKEGNNYRVKREIREMILFATHNFLKDPPFSRLDLISCRNVLIYLNPTAQERVMEAFHFSLRPGGILFLGSSESVDGAGDLFARLNREHHLFLARPVQVRNYTVPESVPVFQPPKNEPQTKSSWESHTQNRSSSGELHQKLLEAYAPPSVVVNEEYDIIHLSEKVGRFFQFPAGTPSQNLLKLIRPELRLELRSALYQAARQQTAVEARNISWEKEGQREIINIQVRPVTKDGDQTNGLILVIFESREDAANGEAVVLTSDEPVARQLEEELIRIKGQLQGSIAQYEYQTEELRASNEELQAMNEEMRSAAEELETSKEELQSINEELRTVNQELKVKIEETSVTSSNLQNLINSAEVATLFLDRGFCTRLYTLAALQIFNLIPSDQGRPIFDITHRLEYNHLLEDAQAVLEKLTVIEREVTTTDGRAFLMRLLPYRTSDDRINGVVITFFDISKRREAESALRQVEEKYRIRLEHDVEARTAELNASKDLLQATMNSALDMIQVFEAVRDDRGTIVDFRWILNNHASEKVYGDVIGKSLLALNPGVVEAGIFDTFRKVVETGRTDVSERHYVHEQFDGWFHQSVVKLNDGVVTTTVDITERKKAEQESQQSKALMQDIIDATEVGIAVFKALRDERGEVTDFAHEYINRASVAMLGEDFTGRLLSDHGVNGVSQMPLFADVLVTGKPNGYIKEVDFRGRHAWFSITNTPLDGDRLVHTWEEVTERRHAEQELLRMKEELAQKATDKYKTIFTAIDDGFCVIELLYDDGGRAVDFIYHDTNPSFVRQAGLQMEGKRQSELFPEVDRSLLDNYDHVAKTGEPVQQEYCSGDPDGRWFQTRAARLGGAGSHQVAVIFRDITERRQREQQQEYLLALNDALRPLVDPAAIQAAAARLLAARLGADRIEYVEVDDTNDRHDDGSTWVVPLIKQDRPVARFVIHQQEVKAWTKAERALVEETAERTWAAVERAKAAGLISRSESRFRTLADAVPQVIWTNDATGRTNYFNQRWYEYTGLPHGQSDVLGWPAIVHPDDAAASIDKWREAQASGEVFDTEYRLRGQDGGYRWFIGRNVPVKDPSGNITGWFGSATDIENLKKTEEALSQSEARLRITMESATDYGIITMDTERKIERWSSGATQLFGYTESEMIGQSADIIFTDEDRAADAPRKEMETARDTGRAADERWHQRKDGSRFFASGVLRPIQDNALTGYVKVMRDVTEQREAGERLRIMEERYRIALQSAELATWDWSIPGDSWQWNDQLYALLGRPPQPGAKDTAYFLDLVHPEDRERVADMLTNAVRMSGIFQADFRVARADGELRWMSGYGRVVASQNEAAARMVGVLFDITTQKLFTEELSRLVAEQTVELQRSNDDLRQFAHVASHDLKEPIRKIQTFNNRILDEYADTLPARVKSFSEKIGTAAERMISMIEGVLRYSKLGKTEQVWKTVNLGEVIQQIGIDLEVLMEQKQALISTTELPTLQANPTLIYQLFYNLILNSLKFSRADEPPRIHISFEDVTEQQKNFAKIIVADNGIGFEPEFSKDIFKTFARLHPVEDYEGTGLGLALCKKIVERHGGTISAMGEPDKGATFIILLPL